MFRVFAVKLFGILFWCFGIHSTNAFGSDGHKIIAKIAESLFTADTKAKVSQVLGSHALYEVAAIADSWDHSPAGDETKPCHYYTVPFGEKDIIYNDENDCYCNNDGLCIFSCLTDVISNLQSEDTLMDCQNAIGKDHSSDWHEGELLCDLALLIHYLGDLHQPLHISPSGDMGGNKVHITDKTGYLTTSSLQLHEIFDSRLILKYKNDNYVQYWYQIADELINQINNTFIQEIGFSTQDTDADTVNNQLLEYFIPIADKSYHLSLEARRKVNETPKNKSKKNQKLTKETHCTNIDCEGVIQDESFYDWGVDITMNALLTGGVRAGTIINSIFENRDMDNIKSKVFYNAKRVLSLKHSDHFVAPLLISSTTNQKTYFVMATSNEAQINTKWVEYGSSNDKQNRIGYQDAKNEIFSSMSNFRFIDEHGDLLLGPTKIAKHVGRMADNDVLTGRTRYEQELINNYLELRNEIEKNYADVIYPIMGRQDPDYTNGLKSMNYFVSLLNSLNQLLSDPEQKFLVNKESITLADFGVASALLPMYKFVFTKDFRENFNFEYATQWYLNVVNSESYNKVLKEFEASLLTKDKRSFELLTGTDDQFANELIDGTIATHKNANNTCGSDGEVGTCQRSTTHRTGLHREARTRRAALSVANEPRQRTLFTIEEFQEFVTIDSSIKFNNVYVVDLNLKEYGKSDFDTWDLEGGTFGGCVFDDEIEKLRPRYFEERNCLDLSNPDPEEGVPFKLFRGFMYTTEELQQVDLPIYEWRENQKILGVCFTIIYIYIYNIHYYSL